MRNLIILLPILLMACVTPEQILVTYMDIPETCDGMYEEMHKNATRIAKINNLREVKTYGISGAVVAIVAGVIPPVGIVVAAIPLIEEFQINTAGNHARINHLAAARLETGCKG